MTGDRVHRHLPVTARDAAHAAEVVGPRYEPGRRFRDRATGIRVEVVGLSVDPVDRHVVVEMVGLG